MNRQRGISNPWLLLIGAIALLAALAAAITAWKSYTNGLVKQGHDAGVAETKASYEARDNKAIADAIAERNAAQEKADGAEKTASNRIADAGAAYQKGLTIANANHATDLATVRSGLERMCSAPTPAGQPGVAQAPSGDGKTAAGGPGVAGTGDAGLRAGIAASLESIAAEANRLRDKANALSSIVWADRLQINGP